MRKNKSEKSVEIFYGTSSEVADRLIEYMISTDFDIKSLPLQFHARSTIVTPNKVEIEIMGGVTITVIMKKNKVSFIVEETSRKGAIRVN
jgi:sugar/nucleoside kinase (ribokinase family)